MRDLQQCSFGNKPTIINQQFSRLTCFLPWKLGEMGKLLAAFSLGAFCVACSACWYAFQRKKDKIKPKEKEFPEDLVREQLSRNYSFLGEQGMQKVRSAFVVVVGAGGVGSHAVHLLARSGIGRIRVVDFDQVSLSSLNRHALATIHDVGKRKTAVLAAHLAQITPFCRVEAVQEKFHASVAEKLLTVENGSGKPDFVVDCIDNIATKVELLFWCHSKGIPIVSSMGSGAKHDPSRIQIADISQTCEDPLARVARRKLKKLGIDSGIPVVYSTEKPSADVRLLPLHGCTMEEIRALAVLPNFRCRILPVLGTLPAIFGCTLACFVVNSIAGVTIGTGDYLACKNRTPEYVKLHKDLGNREKPGKLFVTVKELGMLYEEVWNACSAYSMGRERLCFVRLNREESTLPWNLVLLSVEEASLYQNGRLKLEDWVYKKARLVREECQREQRLNFP